MTPNGHRARIRALLGLTVASSVVSAVLAAPVAFAVPAPVPTSPAVVLRGAPTAVVVSGPGGVEAAAAAVRAANGTVVDPLPLVSGVVAELPAGAVLPGWTVAADRPLAVTAHKDRGDATPAPGGSGAPDASGNGPVPTARQTLGLTAGTAAGTGVTVAVVDTGVADSPDLAGRVRHVDVTGKRPVDGTGDGYGHGTFIAGLVAGNGTASDGRYVGAAPKANLLDVRVAADDGSTSLVSVLRGLQVVSASADELDVRVLNLSLSSGSPLPYQIDPLTQALEGLWRQGITVVTAAGNDGPTPGSVSSPGLDPTLLTVGALDEAGTAARTDDTVASYSSRGASVLARPGDAKPDVVAPGSHLVSLRAPGSTVDATNPASRVENAYFRGTGTSMSTALVSGVVADLLSERPDLSPDQVKALLTGTAYRTAGLQPSDGAGAGGVDAAAALAAPTPADTSPAATNPAGSGAAADPTQAPDPSSLPPGEVKQWDRFAAAMLDGDRSAAFAAWQKLSPPARSWVGRSWVALAPEARSWVARSWVGRSWAGADGTADEWLARSWIARSWVARSWIARSWVGRSWVGRSWVARSWVGRSWVDDDWAARSWVARSWTARSWTTDSWS